MFEGYTASELTAILAMQGFSGLSLFCVFLLMALGLAIIFGQMQVINMAHGEFLTIGAYTTYLLSVLADKHLPWFMDYYFFTAIVLGFVLAFAVGWLVEFSMIRFLYKRPLDTLLATWGLSLIMQQGFRSAFGAREVSPTLPEWLLGSWQMSETIEIPINGLLVVGITGMLTLAVFYLLFRSRWGLKVRATTQNRVMAGAAGSTPPRSIAAPSRSVVASRGRGRGLHHHRLDRPDQRFALHRRHLPGRRVRWRGEPVRHHRVGFLHRPGPVGARVLPDRLHGQGDHPRHRHRHPHAATGRSVLHPGAQVSRHPAPQPLSQEYLSR